MSLDTLPTELLLAIIDLLPLQAHSRLVQSCRRMHTQFNDLLYEREVYAFGSSGLHWAVENDMTPTIERFLAAGSNPHLPSPVVPFEFETIMPPYPAHRRIPKKAGEGRDPDWGKVVPQCFELQKVLVQSADRHVVHLGEWRSGEVSPLRCAMVRSKPEIVEMLLKGMRPGCCWCDLGRGVAGGKEGRSVGEMRRPGGAEEGRDGCEAHLMVDATVAGLYHNALARELLLKYGRLARTRKYVPTLIEALTKAPPPPPPLPPDSPVFKDHTTAAALRIIDLLLTHSYYGLSEDGVLGGAVGQSNSRQIFVDSRVHSLFLSHKIPDATPGGDLPFIHAFTFGDPELLRRVYACRSGYLYDHSEGILYLLPDFTEHPPPIRFLSTPELASILLSLGANINAGYFPHRSIYPPICVAACYGIAEMVKWCLDNGADMMARGCRYDPANPPIMSALHVAAQKREIGIVRMLLEAGVDVGMKNHYGQTALDLARETEENNNNGVEREELVGLLERWIEEKGVEMGGGGDCAGGDYE